MTTARKIAANRQNARHSTGPKTINGKAKSRYNALKSGIYARARLLPGEDGKAYERLSRRLHKRYAPADPVEELLVDQMLGHIWRIGRLERAERAFLQELIEPHTHSMNPRSGTKILRVPQVGNGQFEGQGMNQVLNANHNDEDASHASCLDTAILEAAIPSHESHALVRLGAQRRAHVQDLLALEILLKTTWRKSFEQFCSNA